MACTTRRHTHVRAAAAGPETEAAAPLTPVPGAGTPMACPPQCFQAQLPTAHVTSVQGIPAQGTARHRVESSDGILPTEEEAVLSLDAEATRGGRGASMDLPLKKRRAMWPYECEEGCGPTDADASAENPPPSKRQHLSAPAVLPTPPTPTASVFGMPTGRLSDRFALGTAVLGSGQFGTVRECQDVGTGEAVACKTVKKLTVKAEAQQEELRNEVAVMMRLVGHDNVVQLRGVFEEEEEVHLVMDRCSGGDLFDEVLRRQRFTEPDAAHLFVEIVKAVASCHARGVLHRDLKPENLLLTKRLPEGVPVADMAGSGPLIKLADFGLAGILGQGQKLKGMAGSPFYMAPEVLTGAYNCKADIWSLGVILYILLSGSPPFWGDKDEDVFKAILKGKPDLTTFLWNTVSADAKGLIKCLLVQDPAARPSAQKVLTHPWLLKHLGGGVPRRASASQASRRSVSVV